MQSTSDHLASAASGAGLPSVGEMVGEVAGLTVGLGILLLPLLVTSLPGVILLLIAPAVLLTAAAAAAAVIAAAIIGPVYLLFRAARQRLGRGGTA